MKPEEYKDKLRKWNATEKYKGETEVLLDLLRDEKFPVPFPILDYGCGLGTLVNQLSKRFPNLNRKIFGYDVTDKYYEGDPFLFRNEAYFKFNTIYFMHSLAHILNPLVTLEKIKNTFLEEGGRIIVITPNADYLKRLPKDKNYKPDPTVVSHFTLASLFSLFKEAGFKHIEVGYFEVKENHYTKNFAEDDERLYAVVS